MEQPTGNRISEYLALFREMDYPALFSPECLRALDGVEAIWGDTVSHQVFFEVHLNDDSRTSDFSFVLTEEAGPIRESWLEFDYEEFAGGKTPTPCRFLETSLLLREDGEAFFYDTALPAFVGRDKAARLSPALRRLLDLVRDKGGLFSVGSMDSRRPADCIRVYSEYLDGDRIVALLEAMGWPGDRERLAAQLREWTPLSSNGKFIVSFDLFAEGISDKIGVEFRPRSRKRWGAGEAADWLTERGFCRPDKAEAVRAWAWELPQGLPYIQNDLSHFKFTLENSEPTTVKAYLRMADNLSAPRQQMYRRPVQMNLELTTKCPLHCPQCYVHLNTGEELPREEALYWLREAARSGVRHVNLSGGETLCYPYLDDLLRECRSLGLVSNIALSGAYVTRRRLGELLEAGADRIFVSLNGSTREINEQTRDGYELAIHALELLRELHFSQTTINFVMHRCNADDLGAMIELAERYEVKALVLLAFKPDAAHQLNSFPSAEQLRAAARVIKAYKGPVSVTAEPCFSQLRALVGKRFFVNLNTGVSRGCGAGRDGISVDVRGHLTPCRHLDVPEQTRSITDYWQNSAFLSQLRSMHESREEPCGIG